MIRSPFPGMDPYLEAQGRWRDCHASFITYLREAITEQLPETYITVIDEQVHLVGWASESRREFRPDVTVLREPLAERPLPPPTAAHVATLEPVSIPYAEDEQEVRDTWIEIRRSADESLVTVIELLSPTNKGSSGRADYLAKRLALLRQPVHLVEIDWRICGHRMPMQSPLPPGDFYTLVFRTERRPHADVYSWTLPHPLPTIPIPLQSPDSDLPINLASVFQRTYELGRYDRILKYNRPLDLPLAPDDRGWAEAIPRAGLA